MSLYVVTYYIYIYVGMTITDKCLAESMSMALCVGAIIFCQTKHPLSPAQYIIHICMCRNKYRCVGVCICVSYAPLLFCCPFELCVLAYNSI